MEQGPLLILEQVDHVVLAVEASGLLNVLVFPPVALHHLGQMTFVDNLAVLVARSLA